MRGKVIKVKAVDVLEGITPAHAGKSILLYTIRRKAQDHPRTCGEKVEPLNLNFNNTGSPPHMRGKEWLYYVRY